MSIPSTGQDATYVVDPGVVNIEAQAYPRPLDPSQALSRQLAELMSASLFAAPRALDPSQALPVPTPVDVAAQPFVPPSFQSGVAVLALSEVDVEAQNSIITPAAEFIVTEVGNFQTNLAEDEGTAEFVISAIVDEGTVFKITLDASLVPFGVPFQGREVQVVQAATADNLNQTRTIRFWSVNIIYIAKDEDGESFAVDLAVNDVLQIDTIREGDQVINDIYTPDQDVFLASVTTPPDAVTVMGNSFGFQGNLFASDGVVAPFIGGGVRVPLLLGTFEVANQPPLGSGLPPNVFPT